MQVCDKCRGELTSDTTGKIVATYPKGHGGKSFELCVRCLRLALDCVKVFVDNNGFAVMSSDKKAKEPFETAKLKELIEDEYKKMDNEYGERSRCGCVVHRFSHRDCNLDCVSYDGCKFGINIPLCAT